MSVLGMLVAVLVVVERPSAQADVLPVATEFGFPHPVLYGSLNSAAQPLVDAVNGPINTTVLNQFARWPMVILPPTPLSDLRPDVMTALRTANPNQKIFAYVLGHTTFCTPTYGNNVYYRKYWEVAEAYDNDTDTFCDPADTTNAGGTGDGFLWWQNGAKGDSNVNLAYRVSDGLGGWRYDVAEDLAALMATTVQTGNYDGIFLDIFCDNVVWQETGSLKYDYQRAGYGSDNTLSANRTDFQTGWKAGHAALSAKLRNLISEPNFPIVGNCAQSPTDVRSSANGWMQENFPNQNGGTWLDNMYGVGNSFTGYVADEYTFREPQHNFIFTGLTYSLGNPNEWSTATQQKRMRFGLASAALGNGFAAYEDYAAHAYTAPYHEWWFDEYAVNRQTGASTTDITKTGWLGQPTSEMYQMVTDSGSANLTTNSEFETDTSGWTFAASAPSAGTLNRVVTEGDYAVQATITSLGLADYYVQFGTTTTFPITNGLPITATFWAKSSADRPITLVLYKPGFEYGNQSISISPTWKKYQVTIPATATVGDAKLRFDLGMDSNSVTLDSITVQATSGNNLYRRDFDYGVMLLNPTSATITMTLERTYYKILGTLNPTLNDGTAVSSVTLGANDAIFLLDRDLAAPSAVVDLQTTP